MLSQTALWSIYAYQRWLSPRKGYRCAYSVHHGGTGCSGYAKHAIRDHGLWRALPLIRARFQACKATYVAMHGEKDDRADPPDSKKRKPRNSGWWHGCDVWMCIPSSSSGPRADVPKDSGGGACDATPCDGGLNVNPCDGGGCNCSPCN